MNRPLVAVCEDDFDLGQSLRELIEDAGYRVILATCSEELDILCTKTPPDVLVLDYRLPGENGREIAARYHAQRTNLPIIMMSVNASRDDQIAGFASGAMLYLPKPFEPEALLAAVTGLVRTRQTRKSARVVFNFEAGKLYNELGSAVLSRKESLILNLLIIKAPEPVEYYELLEVIADPGADLGTKASLEVMISRLRKKLREAEIPRDECSIVSSHGFGYSLTGSVNIE